MTEVRSTVSQKILAGAMFVFLTCLGLGAIVEVLSPKLMSVMDVGDTNSEKAWAIVGGLFFLGLGIYTLVSTFLFRLYRDETGIFQTNGFLRQSISWKDIDRGNVVWTRIPNRRTVLVEPVLRDMSGRIKLRPWSPIIVSLTDETHEREEFWHETMKYLDPLES